MKKVLSILLVLVLCLSLCACGGGNADTSKTDEAPAETTVPQIDTTNAIAETPTHIYDDVMENQARAMQNTYMMKCSVGQITNEYFECGNLRIYLPVEDLAKLNKGEEVSVVGKITEVVEENGQWGIMYWVKMGEAQLYNGEVPEVAPREHEIFTGLLKGKNNSYEGAWNIQIGNSNYLAIIYFAEGEDLSAYNEDYNSGEEITFYVSLPKGLNNIPSQFHNAKLMG